MGSLWPAPTGRCASFGGLLGFSFRLSSCLPLCWYAANSNLHQGLWWTNFQHCSLLWLSADLWCRLLLCKTTVAIIRFYDVDIAPPPPQPFSVDGEGEKLGEEAGGWGVDAGATGKWQNWAPAQSAAAAGAHCSCCCRELRAQNWQHRPTLLLSPTALDLP